MGNPFMFKLKTIMSRCLYLTWGVYMLTLLCGCQHDTKFLNGIGRAKEILLIDRHEAHNLATYIEWIDKMPNTEFILEIDNYKPNAQSEALLNLMQCKRNVKILKSIHHHDKSLEEYSILKQTTVGGGTSAMCAVDAFCITVQSCCGREAIYTSSKFNSSDLLTASGISKMNTVSDSLLIPGGNMLTVNDHTFIGVSSYPKLSKYLNPDQPADTNAVIKKLKARYGISDCVTIDFIGILDTIHQPTLYHLDLMLTCTGKRPSDGKYLFFIPQIESTDGTLSRFNKEVRDSLDVFALQAREIFDKRFNGMDTIIRVPAFTDCDGRFIYSPVNGIVDERCGKPVYYFPEPDIRAQPSMDRDRIRKYSCAAMNIFKEYLGKDNVIPLRVPGYMIRSHSQSLHCTMSVLKRGN